jgi:hypothetical protein
VDSSPRFLGARWALARHRFARVAGVARVDIMPPAGILKWGYTARQTPSTGVLDPLDARVLVLDDSHTRIAIVAVDLGRSFDSPALKRLARSAPTSSGVAGVVVAASHTHSGPVVIYEYREGTPAGENTALKKTGQAIDQASARQTAEKEGGDDNAHAIAKISNAEAT